MSVREYILHRLTSRRNLDSLSSRLRHKRLAPLLSMIEAYHRSVGRVNIIDLGGTRRYWGAIDREVLVRGNVHITLVNLTEDDDPADDDDMFHAVQADGCDLPQFADAQFHIGHSNSVIEHVSAGEGMERFAQELRRVSQSLFVQTPNWGFPIEPHFVFPLFHYLPRWLRAGLRRRLNLGYYLRAKTLADARESVDSINLLTARQFQALLPDCTIHREKLFLLTKSLIAIRDRSPA